MGLEQRVAEHMHNITLDVGMSTLSIIKTITVANLKKDGQTEITDEQIISEILNSANSVLQHLNPKS